MIWQLLIITSILLGAVATLLQRILLKEQRSDPITYSILFELFIGLTFGIIGIFTSQFSFSNLKPLVINLIIMGFFYAIGNIFVFHSLKLTEASKYTILNSSRVFFTILASSFILKESLNFKQIIGVFLIILAIIISNYQKKILKIGRGEILAILAAILFGFEVTNDRILLKTLPLYSFLFLAYICPAIVTSFMYPKSFFKMKLYFKKNIIDKLLLLVIFYGGSAILFFQALKITDNSSLFAGIYQTQTVITVILATIFLSERTRLLNKLISALICVIGSIILIA